MLRTVTSSLYFICCKTWITHVLHANKTNQQDRSEKERRLPKVMERGRCHWRCFEMAKKTMVVVAAVTVLLIPCAEAQASVFPYLLLFWLHFPLSLSLFCSLCPCVFSLSSLFCLCFSSLSLSHLFSHVFLYLSLFLFFFGFSLLSFMFSFISFFFSFLLCFFVLVVPFFFSFNLLRSLSLFLLFLSFVSQSILPLISHPPPPFLFSFFSLCSTLFPSSFSLFPTRFFLFPPSLTLSLPWYL